METEPVAPPRPCGCSCHYMHGVRHLAACCSAPSLDHIERVAKARAERKGEELESILTPEFDDFRDGAGDWHKRSPFVIARTFWNAGAKAALAQQAEALAKLDAAFTVFNDPATEINGASDVLRAAQKLLDASKDVL